MADEKYLNFPIQLLCGFMDDSMPVLRNIIHYSTYRSSLLLEYGDNESCFKKAGECLGIIYNSHIDEAIENGKKLYEKYSDGSPHVGLKTEMYWQYRSDHKTDFEKLCLLGFLGLKSIIGKHSYVKTDNKFLFARMDGKVKHTDKLSESIAKYANHYQSEKIRNELVYSWNLIDFRRNVRGYYVSFKLTKDELAEQAEMKRQVYKNNLRKQEEEQAQKRALEKLKNRSP